MSRTHGWSWIAILLGLVVALPTALDARDATPSLIRVRGVGPEINRLIERAGAQSETFRALINDIQQSNAIVVVEPGRCRNGLFRSCVVHLEGNALSRHIRIFVNTFATNDERLMATIAHELHHATELLSDPTVVDAVGVQRFYKGRAMGNCGQGMSDRCETEGALAAEARVLDELRRSSSPSF